MNDAPDPEVVRWYTRARKFPQLIGRTPDGTKLPGGPYTFTQAIGAAVVLFVGLHTMSMWASYGLIGNYLLLAGVTYAAILVLGRMPVGSRSPISVGAGLIRAISSPRTGRLAGRPIRLRRPHRLRHRLVTLVTDPPAPARRHGPGSDPTPTTVSTPAAAPPAATPKPPRVSATAAPRPAPRGAAPAGKPQPALSGVQVLLARSGAPRQAVPPDA